jgi:hypothetical protein
MTNGSTSTKRKTSKSLEQIRSRTLETTTSSFSRTPRYIPTESLYYPFSFLSSSVVTTFSLPSFTSFSPLPFFRNHSFFLNRLAGAASGERKFVMYDNMGTQLINGSSEVCEIRKGKKYNMHKGEMLNC